MSHNIGTRIRLARKQLGLTLRDLASVMSRGISATALSKYERGLLLPTSARLIELSKALGVTVSYLMAPGAVAVQLPESIRRCFTRKTCAEIEVTVTQLVEQYLHQHDATLRPFGDATVLLLDIPAQVYQCEEEGKHHMVIAVNRLYQKSWYIGLLELVSSESGYTATLIRWLDS